MIFCRYRLKNTSVALFESDFVAYEPIGEDEPETFVTEEDYELIRRTMAGVLGAKGRLSGSVLPDMAYSDTPIKNVFQKIWIFIRI